jgi:alkylation response protein AidB-like acyl-CoA dehydrogenase
MSHKKSQAIIDEFGGSYIYHPYNNNQSTLVMYPYRAPINDMNFLLTNMSTTRTHNHDLDELKMVIEQAAKFTAQQLAPANALGDLEGCLFTEGVVSLPRVIRKAFKRYVDAGWMGICMPDVWGGQDLPETIGSKVGEMITSSNHAISMTSALTMSACKALIAFGSEDLKNCYLPKMISGEWTGTMCMTEAHCGSDLGLIKTSAKTLDDTRYELTGTKIFISAGEHDASKNIIHLVLARIKDAPDGIKGLSLFVVPKILPDTNERNRVSCIGIEEKMGIHANPTCTMSFENAMGFLVGHANQGIKAMFTMMNEMRLGTALQGVGMSEQAFQKSYHYAIDRAQGKTLDKAKQTNSAADSLIHHADVRRMIMTQKAFAEGGRAFCHYCAELLDKTKHESEDSAATEKRLGLLTPIAKAFLTETGLESASHAVQVYGGHGFIRESGVEQIYRDGRIATLYEGTTGIQSLDLLGRKVLGDQAQTLLSFTKDIYQLCKNIEANDNASKASKELAKKLLPYAKEWPTLAQQIGMKAMQDHEEVGAAAYDFLMYSGYVTLAYFWLQMANIADNKTNDQASNNTDPRLLSAKPKTAHFYFEKLLPRAEAHKNVMLSGKESLSSLQESEWII